jgi:hypothetical protein
MAPSKRMVPVRRFRPARRVTFPLNREDFQDIPDLELRGWKGPEVGGGGQEIWSGCWISRRLTTEPES